MTAAEEKRLVRRNYRALRRSIPAEKRARDSEKAANRLFMLDFYRKSDKILVYVSVEEEMDTFPILRRALLDGKRLYVPRCDTVNRGIMRFHRIQDPERDLSPGMYGIPEPAASAPVDDGGGGLCVVPGLAFTADGVRLGYGGGYYDRFLESFTGFSVGLCYGEQLAAQLPCSRQDRPVQAVLTPDQLFYQTDHNGGC